jgi:hypothetical protein
MGQVVCWGDNSDGQRAVPDGLRGVIQVAAGNYHTVAQVADCNGDGIADSDQCRVGSLPDYDGNSVPDCCESSTLCEVGHYPVQWRVEDGGNGHWYQRTHEQVTWTDAKLFTEESGGHLVTFAAADEQSFVLEFVSGVEEPFWIGLFQDTSDPQYQEPNGAWRWVTAEPLTWTGWNPTYSGPDNTGGHEDVGEWTYSFGSGWNDLDESWDWARRWAVIEWSDDCNGDGVVDYGQILQGQLADADGNGVPDSCEQAPCPGDVSGDGQVDGVDLALILSEWGGPGSSDSSADVNADGVVEGKDLAIVLSGWVPA